MDRSQSAQSRRAWGSVDQQGVVNPALDDDEFAPAAMESEIYSTKQPTPVPRPAPQPTGCWATFMRGVRCKYASTLAIFFHVTEWRKRLLGPYTQKALICKKYGALIYENPYL